MDTSEILCLRFLEGRDCAYYFIKGVYTGRSHREILPFYLMGFSVGSISCDEGSCLFCPW